MNKPAFIHPTCVIDENVNIGVDTQIWLWTHVSKNVTIGTNCIIGQNVFIGENVSIGNNVKIQNNVIESSWKHNTRRFLFLGSSCIYPKFANQPIVEESLLEDS